MESAVNKRRKATKPIKPSKVVTYIFLIFFSILFLLPFFWMITTAVKPANEIFTYPPKFIPSKIEWSNFTKAWTVQPFTLFFKNSMIVVIACTLGQMISSSLVAYGFARFEFKGRDILFVILLGTMMIPWDVTMIPTYMLFNKFGWINTLKCLTIPSWFGSAYYIFLMRQFLMGIPKELEEAARIDGANAFQIFVRIFIPLMRPALVLVAVFTMMGAWNDYMGPLIFLNDQRKYTLALGLAQFKGMHGVDTASIMAITCIVSIPAIIMFFFAQKSILEGISTSGLKG
jgi:multiple sugar transport system permease protein